MEILELKIIQYSVDDLTHRIEITEEKKKAENSRTDQ